MPVVAEVVVVEGPPLVALSLSSTTTVDEDADPLVVAVEEERTSGFEDEVSVAIVMAMTSVGGGRCRRAFVGVAMLQGYGIGVIQYGNGRRRSRC